MYHFYQNVWWDIGVQFVVFNCNYCLMLPICTINCNGKSHQTPLKNMPINVALLS